MRHPVRYLSGSSPLQAAPTIADEKADTAQAYQGKARGLRNRSLSEPGPRQVDRVRAHSGRAHIARQGASAARARRPEHAGEWGTGEDQPASTNRIAIKTADHQHVV